MSINDIIHPILVDVHIIHSNISPIVGKISYDFSLILPSILNGPEPYTNKLDNPYAANIKHIILFISFNVVFVIYFFHHCHYFLQLQLVQ